MSPIESEIRNIFSDISSNDEFVAGSNKELKILRISSSTDQITIEVDSTNLRFKDKKLVDKLFSANWQGSGPAPILDFKRNLNTPGASASPQSPNNLISGYGLKRDPEAIPGIAKIVVVASGKGGVGKSTVSANLAVALATRGHKTGLLDADLQGPSIPTLMNTEGTLEILPDGKISPKESFGIKITSFGNIIGKDTPFISRGPVLSKSFDRLLHKTAWGDLDYLVIDLPPGTGDIQISLLEAINIDHAIIVTTPQNIALLDAHKGLSMFEKLEIPVLGVVENMSYHICSNCGHQDHIFGNDIKDFLEERQIPLLTRIPLNSHIGASAASKHPIAVSDNHLLSQPFDTLAQRLQEEW